MSVLAGGWAETVRVQSLAARVHPWHAASSCWGFTQTQKTFKVEAKKKMNNFVKNLLIAIVMIMIILIVSIANTAYPISG